jgi:hypothetical protein
MRSVILSLPLILFVTSPSPAEAIILSEMDKETRVYIQRGNTGQNVECYFYAVKMMLQNSNATEADVYVEFDSPDLDGIGIGAVDAGEYYTCEDGVLRAWEMGQSTGIKRF